MIIYITVEDTHWIFRTALMEKLIKLCSWKYKINYCQFLFRKQNFENGPYSCVSCQVRPYTGKQKW